MGLTKYKLNIDATHGTQMLARADGRWYSAKDVDAEIARLQAEVDRKSGVIHQVLYEKRTARNDALEEAAALANTSVNDGGLAKSMAFFVDVADYKSYKQGVSDYSAAIRALIR